MSLPLELIRVMERAQSTDAWTAILEYAWQICSAPINNLNAVTEIMTRDRSLGDVDHYLATACWDLWKGYYTTVNRTSEALANWWAENLPGRAVLILDALSLRETPWILQQANERGYIVHNATATCAELPADTTTFAKAIGFSQRSSLNTNEAKDSHMFSGSKMITIDSNWEDCVEHIGSERDWVFWHHWPDNRLHDHDDPGKGLQTLIADVSKQLTSDGFWKFVERLTKGRRMVITADHGYAASGQFTDTISEQSKYLKNTFKGGRALRSEKEVGYWVPPIDLAIENVHGRYLFVNGRRKWKSQGGYPTLTHGGLSVLEIAVPFVEISRN